MKRKISLLIVLMLILSTLINVSATEEAVEGEETAEAAEETLPVNEPLMLSMEDAVRIATENSREMWKIDDGIAQVKEARKDAKDDKNLAEIIMSIPLSQIEATFGPDFDVTSNQVERILAKNDYYIKFADSQ